MNSENTHQIVKKLRIAFSCVGFPIRSETFILNQIVDLIDKGHHVDIFPYVKCESDNPHGKYVEYKLSEKTFPSGPTPTSFIARLKIFVLFAIHNPSKIIQLIRLLNFFKFGKAAFNLTLFLSAKPYLEKDPYDIYHGHFGESGVALVKLKQAGVIKGKIVTTFHGYDAHFTDQDLIEKRKFYDELFQNGEWFTANSQYTRKKICTLGCLEEKAVRIPVGLNTMKYSVEHRQYNIKNKLNIVSVGRLITVKGYSYGIEAIWHLLNLGFVDIQYLIVGSGELESDLQKQIENLGLEFYVKLMGSKSQEEIIEIMSQSDVFLHPAISDNDGRQEAQGLVLQEAQAMEMAVVATRTGGIPDGVIENETAILVDEKDSVAIANALKKFIEDKELISRFGKRGRKYVEKHFDIAKLNERLVELYLS